MAYRTFSEEPDQNLKNSDNKYLEHWISQDFHKLILALTYGAHQQISTKRMEL
ncbi:hypothetical protein Lsai_1885 [Legionella sainthelensi]|uniref:Uncharacterized protein n=1 Tax=Legionella sainthelensi TaxID=28087 RepID=A0A0W0YJ04_9GAMM|nr:hypothetical protein [Legionella sainthelensi]KTD56908.1 hypothetical protein Lsai_1885 [Legionella sainthelensi]VEH37159.1 Uncharacterised protein [Legionella sainthelensi]